VNFPDKSLKELDSKQLYYSILSGAKRIAEHQRILNKINVFPVPDADTGTNLASTMRSIVNARIPVDSPKSTAVAIADAAMSGARGNSGIIFAQFLYGFSNELENEKVLDIQAFAESMMKAVAYAYDAIANPIEGTILTVIKDWAEHIYKLKDIIDDFIRLLWEAYKKACESLAGTTKQLQVLAKSHVVDAGAKGFVYFLEGILEFFTKGFIQDEVVEDVESEEDIFATQDLHDEITFRFCTEALIEGEKIDKKRLSAAIEKKGDSLVVAGSPAKTRVHIHSDHPADVFHILQGFGEITYEKVEDMVMQHEILHNRKSKIALLTDSTCDLPPSVIDHHQIHVMPLYVHFGETHFLDRLTIQPQQFYSLLEKSERNPSSSQPSTQDFINRYEYLSTHYDSIIGLHLSAALSGTFSNSTKSAEDVTGRTGKKIHLFNSKTLTGGLGLIVLRVARAIEEGKTVEEIVPKIDEWIGKSHLRVTVPTLKYIIRSGRVSPFKSFVARMLDLKPVIAIDQEGKSYMFSKSFTTAASMKKVVKNISRMLNGKKIWEYAIMHANNPEAADWYSAEMEQLTGQKPAFVDHVSPVLAANIGEGVVGVALMLE
jgi:DegV family protein with EDD domain